jgi:molybdopterin converting factor small subunit
MGIVIVGIKVRVRYLAVLKGLSENPERETPIREARLGSLIDTLRETEGKDLKARLFSNYEMRPDVLFFINDVEADLLGGMKAELKDGDEITFLPSVHGG